MKFALKSTEEHHAPHPDGIVTVKIDPKTGKRAAPSQTNAVFEIFRTEYVPEELIDTAQSKDNNPADGSFPEDMF